MRLGCIPGILKQSGSQPNGETLMSLVQRKFDANKGLSRSYAHDLFWHEWCDSTLACTYRHYNQCTVLQKVLQDKLRPAIRKKRPGLLESGILFHHDNAPVHTARAVTDVLAGYKWELLEHPRYSPDLAPCDFHLFPKMKEHLRGQRFETEEDIIQATKVAIKNLDKCSNVTAFKDWWQRIEKWGYYVQ